SGGNLAEQALSAALSYRTQAPLIDSLLNEIGVSGGSLTALTSPLTSTTPVAENVE
ncbi:flotillin, partial [Escherichia coli]|nr:flotillin [Escherichia coli]EKM4486674.1 flotillin [Escherichia coli]